MECKNSISVQKADALPATALAFVGDAVFTLYARERVATENDALAGELHRKATGKVKAAAQAELAVKLLPLFTEEEAGVYRRAKNSKHRSAAKNASSEDYNKATGLEAVLGFLYLTGQEARLKEILSKEIEEKTQCPK